MTYSRRGIANQGHPPPPPQALFQLANAFLPPPALPAFLFASWEKSEFRARERALGEGAGWWGKGCFFRLSRLRSCLLVADPFATQGDGDVERHLTVRSGETAAPCQPFPLPQHRDRANITRGAAPTVPVSTPIPISSLPAWGEAV